MRIVVVEPAPDCPAGLEIVWNGTRFFCYRDLFDGLTADGPPGPVVVQPPINPADLKGQEIRTFEDQQSEMEWMWRESEQRMVRRRHAH